MIYLHRMKPHEFQQAVIEMWSSTLVPLTRTNLLYYTSVSIKQADKFLDEMITEGLLEFDNDHAGELVYTVRGANRPHTGPTTFIRCNACKAVTFSGKQCTRCGANLQATPLLSTALNAWGAQTALAAAKPFASGLVQSARGPKSLVAGAALGLLGPFGWMYAGAWKETIPASLVCAILFGFLITTVSILSLGFILFPLSMVVGLLYTLAYNRSGKRQPLLLTDDESQSSSPPQRSPQS